MPYIVRSEAFTCVCGSRQALVVDSRPTVDGRRRRYECRECGKRFTTYERRVEMDSKDAAILSIIAHARNIETAAKVVQGFA